MSSEISTGIIVGRFQVLELNAAHLNLFERLFSRHKYVAVFLTTNPAPSDRNPLDWVFRAQMFEEVFGTRISTHDMPDLPDDRIWSQELDRRILEFKPEGSVTLYGSEEEFVSRYSGRYQAEIMEASEDDFPDEMPMADINNLRDFRAGVLYATLRRFPTVYPTVDIAVFRGDFSEILLAKKDNEARYRFPGGFVDPEDENYEFAAIRELTEECGELEIDELTYIGSQRIDDWRYQQSVDSVISHLYSCKWVSGEAEAGDDIAEVKWFNVSKLTANHFIEPHQVLYEMLTEFLEVVNR